MRQTGLCAQRVGEGAAEKRLARSTFSESSGRASTLGVNCEKPHRHWAFPWPLTLLCWPVWLADAILCLQFTPSVSARRVALQWLSLVGLKPSPTDLVERRTAGLGDALEAMILYAWCKRRLP